jgi:uncharacterized BrkB/YihY/UPF0761 family membrane protein
MATSVISLLFVLVSCGIALLANARFRDEDRLPMQWWLDGEVTWSAPRRMALAFIPALGLLLFASVAVLFLYTTPRPRQEGLVIPSMLAAGILFLAAQLFHLWMVERTVQRSDR